MPRGKGTHPPDSIGPAEYPAWFAAWSEAQENGNGALMWLQDYEADDIKQLILSVLSSGGALFVGLTRDGGALRLTVMFGDKKKSAYAANADELDIIIQRMS